MKRPSDTPSESTTIPAFFENAITAIFRPKNKWLLNAGGLIRWWTTAGTIIVISILGNKLPHLQTTYILAALGAAITIAGVGTPLLSLMDPQQAFSGMFALRPVRRGVLRAWTNASELVDHPEIKKLFQQGGSGPAQQARDEIMAAARRTFYTSLLAFLILPWIHGDRIIEWLALGVPISFALSTVEEQECIVLTRWVAKVGQEIEKGQRSTTTEVVEAAEGGDSAPTPDTMPNERSITTMPDIQIDTDFAVIAITTKKDNQTRDGLLEHALHMLMAEYRERYGVDATKFVLNKLEGYYGR